MEEIKAEKQELNLQLYHQQHYCEMLPGNICYNHCNICEQKWFEKGVKLKTFPRGEISACGDFIKGMLVPEPYSKCMFRIK